MGQNIQVKIGENGEVVELPLKRYEELLSNERQLYSLLNYEIEYYKQIKNIEDRS